MLLPLEMLIWEDADGVVNLSVPEIDHEAEKLGLDPAHPSVEIIEGAFTAVRHEAESALTKEEKDRGVRVSALRAYIRVVSLKSDRPAEETLDMLKKAFQVAVCVGSRPSISSTIFCTVAVTMDSIM